MPILPGFEDEQKEFTEGQLIVFAVEHYMLILLYFCLLCLIIYNVWCFLIGQKKYKTIPLLFFYIFAFFAVLLRLTFNIVLFTDSKIVSSTIYD